MLETSFFTIWHLGVPFVFHQNLGNSKEIWEKFFWGSVANKYLRKVTEAFQKIPSSFGAVVRKPGLGVNYPPPRATQGLRVKTSNDAILRRKVPFEGHFSAQVKFVTDRVTKIGQF